MTKKSHTSLDTLSLEELKTLRRELTTFESMKKQLGKRGVDEYMRNLEGKRLYVVEYAPALSEDEVWEQAGRVFEKVFDLTPTRQEVIFSPKENLKGGIKVYLDDSLVDMSYSRVEKTFI